MRLTTTYCIIFAMHIFFSVVNAAEVFYPAPDNPNINEKYLFYLHGISVELYGADSWSNTFNKKYEYSKIIEGFLDRGYNVVSEVRSKGTKPLRYAIGISDQINALLEQGVPGNNIAVVGHSRGAFMALMIRPRVSDPDVSIVAMAGCAQKSTTSVAGVNPRRGYNKFLKNKASDLHGRFLSIYDIDDKWFGTCQEAFDESSSFQAKEVVLKTGEGHGVFLGPDPEWIVPVIKWIGW